MQTVELSVDSVIYRKDLYPRLKTDHLTVEKYAESLEVLPPIEVNQHNELIDGWHRWTAYKENKAESIPAFVTPTESDAQLLELAIERNAKFGLQLSEADKRDLAERLYRTTPEKERREKKPYLAKILSVPPRTLNSWLSRTDKETKEKRNRRIFEKWLRCHTQEEIAEEEGITKETVSTICQKMAELPESDKVLANHHEPDYKRPLYNVWKWQEKTPGVKHPGNSEVTIVDNLLQKYTKPFDIVVDPFAGGGSTLDICKKRFRRCWVSDRIPIERRKDVIRQWDITDGLPSLPRWKDVSLVYLDPPYWKQAEGKYSEDPGDLANMSLDDFHAQLISLIEGFAKKLATGAHIALLMQPTQYKAPTQQYTDHLIAIACGGHKLLGLPVMRVQCPYESQQVNAQMNEWGKKNNAWLVLSRELTIWRVQ